jgi:hypothetical protein
MKANDARRIRPLRCVLRDGSRRPNRGVPSEILGGLDGDASARFVIGEQDPASWPRCAPLTSHLLSIRRVGMADEAANARCTDLLDRAGSYFHAHAIREMTLGSEHPDAATSINGFALLLLHQFDFVLGHSYSANARSRSASVKQKWKAKLAESVSTVPGAAVTAGECAAPAERFHS